MKKNLYLLLFVSSILFLPLVSYSQTNLLTNGSFEIGSFTGWIKTTTQTTHYCTSWTIESAGRVCHGNATAPQEGAREVLTGFDGSGGVMTLYQDVAIPALSGTRLTFSFRSQTLIGDPASQNRTFTVQVRDTSNNVLQTVYQYVATSGGNRDSGWRTEQISLNNYFGQTIRLTFVLNIPQAFKGPGQFELDNVIIESFGPTAAAVGVGGQVQTENGYGIGNAIVSFVDADGIYRTARTNNFGYYSFDDVEVGQTYVFQVWHREHQFSDNPRAIEIQDATKDIIFTSSSTFRGNSKEMRLMPKKN